MSVNPFLDPVFQAWVASKAKEGFRIACVAKHSGGATSVLGDHELGYKIFSDKFKNCRRESREWIPNIDNLKRLTKPLCDVFKNLNYVKSFASHTVRFFVGKDRKFGDGENFMWDFMVPVASLLYCGDVFVEWESPVISLSDIIKWEDFTISNFSQKPKTGFKIKISWTKFCVVLLEISYRLLGLDVDTPGVSAPIVEEGVPAPVSDDIEVVRQETITQAILEGATISPILEEYFKDPVGLNLILQVIDIVRMDGGDIHLKLSDGKVWVKARLAEDICEYVNSDNIKLMDIVSEVVISGDLQLNNLVIGSLLRRKSLQLKTVGKVGDPVPLAFPNSVVTKKRKRAPLPRTHCIPDIDDLLDDRYLFYVGAQYKLETVFIC